MGMLHNLYSKALKVHLGEPCKKKVFDLYRCYVSLLSTKKKKKVFQNILTFIHFNHGLHIQIYFGSTVCMYVPLSGIEMYLVSSILQERDVSRRERTEDWIWSIAICPVKSETEERGINNALRTLVMPPTVFVHWTKLIKDSVVRKQTVGKTIQECSWSALMRLYL